VIITFRFFFRMAGAAGLAAFDMGVPQVAL
jgi:hypothetical protein